MRCKGGTNYHHKDCSVPNNGASRPHKNCAVLRAFTEAAPRRCQLPSYEPLRFEERYRGSTNRPHKNRTVQKAIAEAVPRRYQLPP